MRRSERRRTVGRGLVCYVVGEHSVGVIAAPTATPQPSMQGGDTPTDAGSALGEVVAVGVVTRVVDGDTVEVTDARSTRIKVRVLGIDTPETQDPRTGVQCWGPEATANAKQALSGNQVQLRVDPPQDASERYGRVLAYVILPNGANYSVEAARAGAARSYVYGRPVLAHAQIVAAENTAKAARRGLWGPPCNGSTTATSTMPPTTKSTLPVDPRFSTCKAAIAAGYGPYVCGIDPEYGWYRDADGDGIVCER